VNAGVAIAYKDLSADAPGGAPELYKHEQGFLQNHFDSSVD
jgi:hypothetical protein